MVQCLANNVEVGGLQALNLSKNKAGAVGSAELFKLLRSGVVPSLNTLLIGDLGLKNTALLGPAISGGVPGLTTLDISSIAMGKKAARAFCDGITNSAITGQLRCWLLYFCVLKGGWSGRLQWPCGREAVFFFVLFFVFST